MIRGETVRIHPAEIGKNVVLLLEAEYKKLRDLLEEELEDRIVQKGWQQLAYRGLALSLEDEP